MKKIIIYYVITMIFALLTIGCKIWGIVSFCIYLFKDEKFNWWSLICLTLCAVFTFVMHAYTTIKSTEL